jgi:restriction system protein
MVRRTRAQRRASQRNLARARRIAAHRRARKSRQGVLVRLAVAVILLVIAVALVQSTHGLVFLPIAAVLAGVILWKVQARRRRVRLAEAHRRHQLQLAQDLGQLLLLTPSQFEHTVGTVLTANGWHQVSEVGRVGDRGADLLGLNASGVRCVVQCKRYGPGSKVSSPDLQRFLGAIQIHGCQRGVFVTTSGYTKQAVAIASAHNVELIDGQRLVALARAAEKTTAVASRELVPLTVSKPLPPDPPKPESTIVERTVPSPVASSWGPPLQADDSPPTPTPTDGSPGPEMTDWQWNTQYDA